MSTTPEPIIRTSGLTRRFGKLTAVDRLDLEIAPGEIFGLVGPDGAGKTTVLRLLCGMLDPTNGEAWVAGFTVRRDPAAVRDRIGYMAQRFGLYRDLTVSENMRFYADLFGISRSDYDSHSRELLGMTRMAPFRGRPAGQLSGGMKQKLALMCTLLHRPRILLLDEPTNGVDPVSRRDFWIILYRLVKSGLTVVIATAYLDEAERCSRVGLLHRGRLIRCEPPDLLKRGLPDCFEVLSPGPREAAEILRHSPGVLSVEPSGASLRMFLAPEAGGADRLNSLLAAGGLPPAEFRPVEPSLEDAFIALIRKADTAAPTGSGPPGGEPAPGNGDLP